MPVEVADPPPAPGEVRVRVLACGDSFTDAQLRARTYIACGGRAAAASEARRAHELLGSTAATGKIVLVP
ncbi:hypothetical protein [Arthrobacter sp. ok909]|uniref:hypothetical protein n=1 Tax=Arthrobacter sp. ok909 TaxID=1761746 RepID=UPI000AB902C0|nr:hypothetical protein [Arthrobacter sp. ok909]